MNTDTPRTDAEVFEAYATGGSGYSLDDEYSRVGASVSADFARQLERELAEAKKDSERLDWLDKQGLCGVGHISYGDYRYYFGDEFPPVREAIDAARKT